MTVRIRPPKRTLPQPCPKRAARLVVPKFIHAEECPELRRPPPRPHIEELDATTEVDAPPSFPLKRLRNLRRRDACVTGDALPESSIPISTEVRSVRSAKPAHVPGEI